MTLQPRALLATDGLVILALGATLLLFPAGLVSLVGLPGPRTYFELLGAARPLHGLGLGGAIVINLCGGGAVVGWLPASNVALPLRGRMTLQVVAVAVLAIGIAEIWTRPWRSTPGRPE